LCHLHSSLLLLSSKLLYLDYDELCWLERCKANHDIHYSSIDVVLSGCFFVALDQVCLFWSTSLESSLSEEVVHKFADVQPYLWPERFIVWFKAYPLGAAIEALLYVKRHPAH